MLCDLGSHHGPDRDQSLETVYMTRRIDPEVEAEREFLANSLERTRMVTRRDYPVARGASI